jgi:hypothetical protein
MKAKPTYVILAMCGDGWEANGPLAATYHSLKDAETAASALSLRYPHKTLGVYELRSLLGTQQKVVKQRVESAEEPAKAKPAAKPAPKPAIADNILKIRA